MSLPEVVTSCVAARKGQSALAVGNVIGSNIFNILGVLGVSSMLHPVPVALAALSFDIPIMILSTCVCFHFAFTYRTITKGEGAIMLGFYGAYLGYLVLMAKQHAEMPVVSELMLVFVLPLLFYFFYNRKVKSAN